MEADGSTLGTVETAAESKTPGFSTFNDSGRREEFRDSCDARVGADVSEPISGGRRPGVVYHSLGVNGANVTLLSRSFSGPHWAAELRHYKPDLVIINYGTNESGYPTFRRGHLGTGAEETP